MYLLPDEMDSDQIWPVGCSLGTPDIRSAIRGLATPEIFKNMFIC